MVQLCTQNEEDRFAHPQVTSVHGESMEGQPLSPAPPPGERSDHGAARWEWMDVTWRHLFSGLPHHWD